MSIQAIVWVLEDSEARLGARQVLISIANHADRWGRSAYPSIRTIARESRLSVREVQYSIRKLVESGELAVDRGGGPGGTNSYCLLLMAARSGNANFAVGGVQTGVQNPARNKEEQKQPESNTPLTPLPSRRSELLTVRDRRRLDREVWRLMDMHKEITLAEALEIACAELMLPVEAARNAVIAAGLKDALREREPAMRKPVKAVG
jgi:hypothetical protein